MKRLITAIITVCSFLSLDAQEIVKGEYFFNSDPGYNNGVEISIVANENIDTEIDITFPSDLPYGINTMYIRFLDANNVWSHKLSKTVFVDKEESRIASIEYYYQSNDGETSKQIKNFEDLLFEQDTALFIDAGNLEEDKSYTLYAVALDEFGVRSFGARKDFVFHSNNDPEALKTSLSMSMSIDDVLKVSMDSLFSDLDIVLGDSLTFEIANSDNQNITEIASWETSGLLELSPNGENASVYNFDIVAMDLMGKKTVIPTILTVYSSTGIEDEYSNNILLYPNPASDYLFIENTNGGDFDYIKIFNINGQIVFEKSLVNETGLNISPLSNGVYSLHILKGSERTIKRLIIQH